jgi:uncharacterized protein
VDRRLLAAAVALGALLAVGLAAAGALVGSALYRARAAERYVTVKGLSEREVPADLVIWPVVFSVTGDDLAALQGRVEHGRREGPGLPLRARLRAFGDQPRRPG